MQISATPLPGYGHIYQQYLQHTYVYIHIQWDVREALGNCIGVCARFFTSFFHTGSKKFYVQALARLMVLEITFLLSCFLSLNFHELLSSVMSACFITEVKQP